MDGLKLKLKIEEKMWWGYLEEDLQELLRESILLLDRVDDWKEKFHDYAFVVFPASKAYEGFLKKLFLDMGFITEKAYFGKRFRIGKALNPSLPPRLRKRVGVYDKLVHFCGDNNLAEEMWDTWKTCRNLVFHWFPNEKNALDYSEAKACVEKVIDTMDLAFNVCKIEQST